MRYLVSLLWLSLLAVSCGQKPESDIVGYGDKNFQYVFVRNPLYDLDTLHNSTQSTFYLYSALPGNTQFSVRLDHVKPGYSYKASFYNLDTTSPILLSSTPIISFPAILATDSTELAYTSLLPLDLDTFVQKQRGFFVVHEASISLLTDSNMIIKGRVGK